MDEERKFRIMCFQIPNKSRSTRKYAREDTEHSSALETKRNGMELSVTHLKEHGIPLRHRWWHDSQRNWSPSVQEYECFELWNSEKKEKRHHTHPCGCFEHRTLISHDSLSSETTEQLLASVKSSVKCRMRQSRLRKRFVEKENEQLLKNVKTQEGHSFGTNSKE